MKIAVFSSKDYDREYFEKYGSDKNIEFTYFETSLNIDTVNLSLDFDAVCVFVNDKLDDQTIQELAANGVKLIALRCAGFNNVDLKSAKQ
ncbi:MAG: 2-hydroxyacid dehydrogenase, partial [Christiangramia sp.]|nr:2-hydroxyacid dehydrogenase [Christiangramia sp.]